MKTLFLHGGEKVKMDSQGNFYTDGSFSKKIWDRYNKYFGDITAIFRYDDSSYNDAYIKNNFNYVGNIKVVPIDNIRSDIFSFLSIKKRHAVSESIKKQILEADFVIIRMPSDEANIAINICRKLKKPYLVEVVACAFDTLRYHSFLGKIIAPMVYIQSRHNIKKAPYVQYVTKKFLQDRYPSDGYSVSCSDVEISNIKKRETMRDKTKLTLGTIGAIDVEYKGQKKVLKAMKKLLKRGYDLEYRVVGSGSPKGLLTEAKKLGVEANVVVEGPIPHERIAKWLSQVDVYIQPSDVEGLCRSLIEAMNAGCPCIASDVGGNIELLDNEYIFKRRSVDDLVKKITSMYNYEEREAQSIRNYRESLSYSKDRLFKIRERFYSLVKESI